MKEPLKTGLAPYFPYANAEIVDETFEIETQWYRDMKDLLTRLAIQYLPKNGITPSDATTAMGGDMKFDIRCQGWDASNLPNMFATLREEIREKGSSFQYKRVNTSYVPSPGIGIDIEVPGAYVSCVRMYGATIPEKCYPESAKIMILLCFI